MRRKVEYRRALNVPRRVVRWWNDNLTDEELEEIYRRYQENGVKIYHMEDTDTGRLNEWDTLNIN